MESWHLSLPGNLLAKLSENGTADVSLTTKVGCIAIVETES